MCILKFKFISDLQCEYTLVGVPTSQGPLTGVKITSGPPSKSDRRWSCGPSCDGPAGHHVQATYFKVNIKGPSQHLQDHLNTKCNWFCRQDHLNTKCNWFCRQDHLNTKCNWLCRQDHLYTKCNWLCRQDHLNTKCNWFCRQDHLNTKCNWFCRPKFFFFLFLPHTCIFYYMYILLHVYSITHPYIVLLPIKSYRDTFVGVP